MGFEGLSIFVLQRYMEFYYLPHFSTYQDRGKLIPTWRCFLYCESMYWNIIFLFLFVLRTKYVSQGGGIKLSIHFYFSLFNTNFPIPYTQQNI